MKSVKGPRAGGVAFEVNMVHTTGMRTWWTYLRSLWRRKQEKPQAPEHLGGRGIPKILGVCEDCGAVVVEGLHQLTASGCRCQRCAGSPRHRRS